ncbi:MAG TPA: PLP-dependent aminotransferase family protein [Gaiellaceae bacterium]|nr:PLP-dependent aminotransferase family protein [Gaiellaceae bacterium]
MAEQPISFARGAPGLSLIPADELTDCAHAVAKREGAHVFAYGPGGGYAPLREWIAERHGVETRRVVLTVGGLQGFSFYVHEQLAYKPGRVIVEAPTYDRTLTILARHRAEVVALPMDDEGLLPDALEAELDRTSDAPSFLYSIPTFQNPSGRTLSTERRRRIVEIVRDRSLPVLEDDPYGLVRFEGEPVPSLFELEGGSLVTHTSSFSKTAAPGLRTGYFVLPSDRAASYEEHAVSTYISPPFLVQATISEFLSRGLFEGNLARVVSELRARRDAMLGALERTFPSEATWNRPLGGYFLWLELAGVDTGALAERAAREVDVAIVPGRGFFLPGSDGGGSSVRLAFSYETPERIVEGVGRLASLLG